MENVILTIHIIACIVMTIVIMLQRSEGGALGIGGGGGGGLMTGRSAAGALVRVTMVFGGIFFLTSLGLTTLANRSVDNRSTLERVVDETQSGESSEPVDLLDPGSSLSDALGPAVVAPEAPEPDAPVAEEADEGDDSPEDPEEPVDNP